MSGYKTFAVWGAGQLGEHVVDQLLALKTVTVTVLTRAESKDNDRNKAFAARGASVVAFDVNNPEAAASLHGIDVLISTVGHMALDKQFSLIHLARSADVRLFVPAEWGDWTDGRTEPMLVLKQNVRAEASKAGLPTASFYHGPWPEILPFLGFDIPNKKIAIHGSGTALISMTSIVDVGRFVAHALTSFPRDKLENAQFKIEGDRTTFNAVAEGLQKLSSQPLEIVHIPRAEAEKSDNPRMAVLLGWDDGKGALPGELSNGLWPEWKPKKALEVTAASLA